MNSIQEYECAFEYADQDDFTLVGIVGRNLCGQLADAIADGGFGDQFQGQGIAHVAFPQGANAVR
jgi:hypothetical protein